MYIQQTSALYRPRTSYTPTKYRLIQMHNGNDTALETKRDLVRKMPIFVRYRATYFTQIDKFYCEEHAHMCAITLLFSLRLINFIVKSLYYHANGQHLSTLIKPEVVHFYATPTVIIENTILKP